MKEIGAAYEKESGDKLQFNFGASNTLARQIVEGAPADLFLSADEAKMDGLEKKGLLLTGTRRSLLSNSLVIVVPSDECLVLCHGVGRMPPLELGVSESRPRYVSVDAHQIPSANLS